MPGRGSGRGGPRRPDRGGGRRRAAVAMAAPLRGSGVARELGKRGSGVRGSHSRAHLGLGRGEEAGRQEQAAAVLGCSGGSAKGAERGYGGGGHSWWRRATRWGLL
jgi:hypothetical protein